MFAIQIPTVLANFLRGNSDPDAVTIYCMLPWAKLSNQCRVFIQDKLVDVQVITNFRYSAAPIAP